MKVMSDDERMEIIKKEWFGEHKAKYEKLSEDTAVLTWKKDGTSIYYARYLLDRNTLIVTGDIGDAVFCLTEKADFENLATHYGMHYLFGKIRAHNQAYDFNSDKAIESLEYRFSDYEFDTDEEQEEFNELKDEIFTTIREECNTQGQWAYELNTNYYEKISDYDTDCFEWIYDIGEELSWQALGWVVGLRMAYDQLKEQS